MKPVLSVLLVFVFLAAGCVTNDQPAPTTSTTQGTNTTTTEATTSTASSSTTELVTTTTTTTLAPQCFTDEDCGLGGWCRTGVCCGTYDNCGFRGECYRNGYMREDGYRCFNGLWTTKSTLGTTTSTASTTTTTRAPAPKKGDGEPCYFDSECESGDCMADVCCSGGQCGFNRKCYGAGEKRADGRICQTDGSWKKPNGVSCFGGGDCVSGYCKDNVCCGASQCGSVQVVRCYDVGQTNLENDKVCFNASSDWEVRWGKKEGASCRVGSECSTENCASGFCCYRNSCGYLGQCYGSGSEIDYGKCVNGTWKN